MRVICFASALVASGSALSVGLLKEPTFSAAHDMPMYLPMSYGQTSVMDLDDQVINHMA